jgi:hypothetical protein
MLTVATITIKLTNTVDYFSPEVNNLNVKYLLLLS